MKKSLVSKLSNILRILTVIVVLAVSIGLTACGHEHTNPASGIVFKTLTVTGNNAYGKVSNDTEHFSFINEISAFGSAKYIISLDITGSQPVQSKTIDLDFGDNTIYVIETINDEPTNIYTVTIRRRPIYTVTFDSNGGTAVNSISVEEGKLIPSVPSTSRTGYTFVSWNFDFSQAITENTRITAEWSAHTDTAYKVEYYLQNLEKNGYDLVETQNLVGTTDTTATAEQKIFDHFTFDASKSVMSGNINSDGSRVLKVYYTRNTYTVSSNNTSVGSVSNTGSFLYGRELTLVATAIKLGYKFVGWYSADKLLSTNVEYTTVIDRNIEARFEVSSEMQNFNFTSTSTTCTISGIKNKTVIEIVVPDYVTSISKGAFSGCSFLESITIPFVGGSKSATSASSSTLFGYIFGTSSYTGGVSTKQYYSYSYGATYYIPSSLKSVTVTGGNIHYGAFGYCTRLTSVAIGNGVESIGNEAFGGCTSLTSITIPDSVTTIGSSAFAVCTRLTSITIPDSVTSIGNNAFRNCTSLTSVTIGDSVTSIGSYAFEDCTSLTSVTMPDSVKTIGDYAFWYCTSLTSIKIPDSVTIIGSYAFDNCTSLTSVTIGNGVTSIGSCAFSYCSSLTSVTIPDSVTSIRSWTFEYCTSLTSVIVGDSVTSIDNSAFSNCTSLTSVTIPDSVTSIFSHAFSGCTSLTSITFEGTVTQWNRVTKYSSWNSNVPTTEVICSDGKVTLS